MEKVSLPFFYQLGAQLNPLTKFTPTSDNRVDIFLASFPTHTYVHGLMTSPTFSTLTVCRAPGLQLIDAILAVQQWMRDTPADKWTDKNASADAKFKDVIDKAKQFETVLSAELQTVESYHVSQKGIYSTAGLMENAENMLPPSLRSRIGKDVIQELRQSGRCLAFDVPTASGFHILRATELVLHEYYINVCKPQTPDHLENWGAYIAELKKSKGPSVKETVALLQQIKDNERNLIMHPERVLSPDDAFTLFEIAKGAIMAMAGILAEKKTGEETPI